MHNATSVCVCRAPTYHEKHKNREWSARDFRLALMKDMWQDGELPEDRGISTKTVCFYLYRLGIELIQPKKGI